MSEPLRKASTYPSIFPGRVALLIRECDLDEGTQSLGVSIGITADLIDSETETTTTDSETTAASATAT